MSIYGDILSEVDGKYAKQTQTAHSADIYCDTLSKVDQAYADKINGNMHTATTTTAEQP